MTKTPCGGLRLISGRANLPLAMRVAERLGVPLCEADSPDPKTGGPRPAPGRFPDGEVRVQVQQTVRGKDVFVIQPTCPPVNDHLIELLLMTEALRRASAQMICAVVPYFGYARQDRKKAGRVPISARLVANLLETAGVDRVLTIELHAGQIQGFFDVPVDHLRTDGLFADHIRSGHREWLENLVVVSPDIGGVWRARRLAKALGTPMAIVEKHREGGGDEAPEVYQVIGEVVGRDVLIVDDILSTGETLGRAAEALRVAGAEEMFAACTHGVFCGEALSRLDRSPLRKVIVTDTIHHRAAVAQHPKVEVVSVAGLLAEAIRRIVAHESMSDLFAYETTRI